MRRRPSRKERRKSKELYEEIMRLTREGILTILPLSEAPLEPEWLWPIEIEDRVLAEGLQNNGKPKKLEIGDVVVAKSFLNINTGQYFSEMAHKVFVILDKIKNTYFGYMLFTPTDWNIKGEIDNINFFHIHSYNSIICEGKLEHDMSATLNTKYLYQLTPKDTRGFDNEPGYGKKGRVNSSFIKFVQYIKTVNNIKKLSWETFEKEN